MSRTWHDNKEPSYEHPDYRFRKGRDNPGRVVKRSTHKLERIQRKQDLDKLVEETEIDCREFRRCPACRKGQISHVSVKDVIDVRHGDTVYCVHFNDLPILKCSQCTETFADLQTDLAITEGLLEALDRLGIPHD